MEIKCIDCEKLFKARSIKCEICSKDRGEPMYHLYSDRCEKCRKINETKFQKWLKN